MRLLETYAEKDKGAFLNNRPIYTKKFDIHKSLFSVYLSSIASPKSFEIAKKPRRVRSLGAASLDMCSVAGGSSDLYYINVLKNVKDSRLRVVDIAASTLIVREAGGEVFDLNEELLDLEFNLRNRSNIIVVGDKKVLEVIR
jgi:fructose-1,6-bisphosphatase/inositol monophosphatase family enzyme